MLVKHDLHVHTSLSACAKDPEATASNYIERAAQLGLETIGFADHFWDRSISGASEWYKPQDLEHILQIKEMLPSDTHGVRVLIGCESEYCGEGKVGVTREAAKQLDFVLLPASHFHMKDFVCPSAIRELKDVAQLLVQRFQEAVGLGIATGIAHPFLPLGFNEQTDEIIALISDAAFSDCFGLAAEASVSIEIQPGNFPNARGLEKAGLHDETFLRVFSIAKEAGCFFHFGSDAHALESLDSIRSLQKPLADLGIEESDIVPCLR